MKLSPGTCIWECPREHSPRPWSRACSPSCKHCRSPSAWHALEHRSECWMAVTQDWEYVKNIRWTTNGIDSCEADLDVSMNELQFSDPTHGAEDRVSDGKHFLLGEGFPAGDHVLQRWPRQVLQHQTGIVRVGAVVTAVVLHEVVSAVIVVLIQSDRCFGSADASQGLHFI